MTESFARDMPGPTEGHEGARPTGGPYAQLRRHVRADANFSNGVGRNRPSSAHFGNSSPITTAPQTGTMPSNPGSHQGTPVPARRSMTQPPAGVHHSLGTTASGGAAVTHQHNYGPNSLNFAGTSGERQPGLFAPTEGSFHLSPTAPPMPPAARTPQQQPASVWGVSGDRQQARMDMGSGAGFEGRGQYQQSADPLSQQGNDIYRTPQPRQRMQLSQTSGEVDELAGSFQRSAALHDRVPVPSTVRNDIGSQQYDGQLSETQRYGWGQIPPTYFRPAAPPNQMIDQTGSFRMDLICQSCRTNLTQGDFADCLEWEAFRAFYLHRGNFPVDSTGDTYLQGADGMGNISQSAGGTAASQNESGQNREAGSAQPAGPAAAGTVDDDDSESTAKRSALETCLEALIKDQDREGKLKRTKLLRKADIDEKMLDELLYSFPGFIMESEESANVIQLAPITFIICGKHSRKRSGCHDKRCRKLHICKKFILENSCSYGNKIEKEKHTRKGRSRDTSSRRGRAADCPKGHTLKDSHNLRVLHKFLEVPDIGKFEYQIIEDLVAFCAEVEEEEDDEEGTEDDDERGRRDGRRGKEGIRRAASKSAQRRGSSRGRSRNRDDDSDEWEKVDHRRNRSRRASSNSQQRDGGRRASPARDINRGNQRFVRSPSPPPSSAAASHSRNRNGPSSSRDGINANIVCADNAKGRCRAGSPGCGLVHAPNGKLYQWQVQDRSGPWMNLSDDQSDKLERNFAKPDVTMVSITPWTSSDKSTCTFPETDARQAMGNRTWEADFERMILAPIGGGSALQLRRVGSYPASGNMAGETKWTWYFLDNKGNWVAYGGEAEAIYDTGKTTKSDLKSDDIEKHFVAEVQKSRGVKAAAGPETAALNASPMTGIRSLSFQTGYHTYTLDFAKMAQINVAVGTERLIRRRPTPQSSSWLSPIVRTFRGGNP